MPNRNASQPTSDEIIARMLDGREETLRGYPTVRLWPDGPLQEGGCFLNAIDVAAETGTSVVVGYASEVRHAWVVDDNDIAWEVTWPYVGWVYFGTPLIELVNGEGATG